MIAGFDRMFIVYGLASYLQLWLSLYNEQALL